MKYLIALYPNVAVMDAMSEEEKAAVFGRGHQEFMNTVKETGEFVGTLALGMPDQSTVVRSEGGVPAVTDGPFAEAKEFVGGFYVVDVESRERAHELAAMIPDAAIAGMGVEVRPIVFSDGGAA